MKKHRDYDAMPDLSMQIDNFSTDWWQWWEVLQPEWRGDGLYFSHDILGGVSWAKIHKGGSNGCFHYSTFDCMVVQLCRTRILESRVTGMMLTKRLVGSSMA